MTKYKLFWLCLLLIAFVLSPSNAQEDLPLVGIVKFGSLRPINLAEQGILDMFDAYGYKNGENIEIRQVDAGGDVTLIASTVEVLLSEGADIIMPIQAAAISATMDIVSELENPPAVIFSVIQDPYALGLAEDACTKPSYFTGQASSGNNNITITTLFASIRELKPSLHRIAYVYNSNDPGAVLTQELFERESSAYDFNLMIEPVGSGEEVVPVIESLLVAGAESILVADVTAGGYMNQLSELSIQAQVPLFSIDSGGVYLGATLGVGTDFYQLGVNAGRIAVNYLDGTIDLASTGISEEITLLRAFNMDVAAQQGLTVPAAFVDTFDFHIENAVTTEAEPSLPDLSLDELRALDAEFLATLQCPREAEATEEAGN